MVVDEMRLIRKILSKLRRRHSKRIRIVDLFGGVNDNKKRSPYRYYKHLKRWSRHPEVIAFKVARKLERSGCLQIVYAEGRNWLVSKLDDNVPWREFWNAL